MASKKSIAVEIAKRARSKTLKPVSYTEFLGTSAAGGRKRITKKAMVRSTAFSKNLGRKGTLKKQGVNTAHMARAAGIAAVSYVDDTHGVADSVIKSRRPLMARAAAHEGNG